MDIKGQAATYAMTFMMAICLIILGIALAFPINQITTEAMNTTSEVGGMDCNNASISDFTKAGCITMDIGQSYFIGGLIALAGIIIAARIIFQ